MSKPEVVEIEGKHLSLTNLDKVLVSRRPDSRRDKSSTTMRGSRPFCCRILRITRSL